MSKERAMAAVDQWPIDLRLLARVIGPERTLELAEAVGGLDTVYIPHRATLAHVWTRVLTRAEWERVTSELGGQRLTVPRHFARSVRKAKILELAEQGYATREISLRVLVGERYVRRVLQDLERPRTLAGRVRADPRQMRLLGDD